MVSLNLPQINYNIRKNKGKVEIFDIIRKKFIVLTPEEWVRQHMVHFLISERSYPKGLMRVEGGLNYHQKQKRSDVLIYDRKGNPYLIVECKTFRQPLRQAAMNQAAVYNKTLGARYLVITNGLQHFCAEVLKDTIRQLDDIPYYGSDGEDNDPKLQPSS